MFGYQGGESTETVARKRGSMEGAQARWPFMTRYDLTTIHNEAQLTTRLGSSRTVHVVRRCADLAELLGTAAAGTGRVAIVSAELRGLDRGAIHDLSDAGVLVLGVHRPGVLKQAQLQLA